MSRRCLGFSRPALPQTASALISLTNGVLPTCSDPNWWHHAWAWPLVNLLYGVLAFTVAGLVLGRFVKPGAANS